MAPASCPQCGVAVPAAAKFCSECGTRLDSEVTERRERRVVTTLFADLAGFTRRSESLDVEDVEGFLDPYFAVLREEVERTGGLVAKFTGDGVMALFGAFVAHEDDPERAVRCGLAICNRVGDLRGDLHVRVGITTGEVVVTLPADGHPDAIGDVVNTAARLEAAAPTDRVLVDASTYRSTSRAIQYDDAEPVAAKGKSEPVRVWVARAPRSIVPEQYRDRLPLVGRGRERGLLVETWERSRDESSTQLVSVIGEPGIGKSRLVDELYAYVGEVPELVTWRRGRSLAYGEGIAFWALGEMIKLQAGILESDTADVARAKLHEAVDAICLAQRDTEWVARHLGPLVGLEAVTTGSEGGRGEAFAAWRRFLEALAEAGPTVLAFEDIHWADDALLDFIDLMADRGGAVPLLIVCTARPELLERRPGWAGGKTNAHTLMLTPLSDQDTARLVGGLLQQTLLPAEIQHALVQHADGNPLYAQEYVRMLQDRDLLVHHHTGWDLAGQITDLPETIQGIIAARLDALSPDQKSLIQDAAVIGRTAWIGAVCALTKRSTWDAEELLHALERKQLVVRERRSSLDGETEFTFGHALTRDVAYSQIRRAQRAQKHEAAAAWIEQHAAHREDKAELLADHYHQALQLRRLLGEDTTPLTARARAAFAEAAEQASAVYAWSAAARHYHAAIELTPADHPQRPALLFGEARALYNGSDTVDVEFFREVIDAQLGVYAWEAAAHVELMLGNWYKDHEGDADNAAAHQAKAAEYAAHVPTSEITCKIAAHRAFRLYLTGATDEALTILAEQMVAASGQAGLAVGQARLFEVRGMARVEHGEIDAGIADMRHAAETFAAHSDSYTTMVYSNLSETMTALGDFAAADDALATAADWASRYGETFFLEDIACQRAYQLYHAGDWATALTLISQIQTTNGYTDANIRLTRGRTSLARGAATDALDDAKVITEFATASENDYLLFQGLALEGRIHTFQPDLATARRVCDRYLANWHRRHGLFNTAITLCELALALAWLDRHNDLRGAAVLLPEASRWRRPLLLTADMRYAEAATLYAEVGSHPLTADAHLLAARQAAAEGRTSDANRHADGVSEFAAETGATLYQLLAASPRTTQDATSA